MRAKGSINIKKCACGNDIPNRGNSTIKDKKCPKCTYGSLTNGKPKRNKFNAIKIKAFEKTGVNSHGYDSRFEKDYALEVLEPLRLSGEVLEWKREESLELRVNGTLIAKYKIDYIVRFSDGWTELIEVKGAETDTWRLKWKLTQALLDGMGYAPVRLVLIKKGQRCKFARKEVLTLHK